MQRSLDLFIAIFNFFLDATVVLMPMPVLWGLQMAVSKKVALSGIFGMGTAYNLLQIYDIDDGELIYVPQNLCLDPLPRLRH